MSFTHESIQLFYSKGSSKGMNDAENKVRESILVFLANPLPAEYAENTLWVQLYTRFHEALRTICGQEYGRVDIKKMAGRAHNYDLLATFYGTDDIEIRIAKLEFKHNCSSLDKAPQILSLQDRFGLIPAVSYAKYYYDTGLDAYIATVGYIGEKPNLDEYMALVCGTEYSRCPMTQYMYEVEAHGDNKKQCTAIVKESISGYLDKYASTVDIDKLNAKLLDSQMDKYFLLWDLNRFGIHTYSQQDLRIRGEYGMTIKNKNTIVLMSDNYEYHLLLRWRNHAGILNPAWQIKVVRHGKSAPTSKSGI